MDTEANIRGLSPAQRIQLARKIAAYVGMDGATGEMHRLQAVLKLAGAASEEAALEALRAHVAEHLPAYMRPRELRPIRAFPRLPNGKVDRGALAAEAITPIPASAPPTAKRDEGLTGPQEALLEIWKTVLQQPEIGLHDNFFALGGDSLAAMRVLTLARQRSLRFSVADLFARPTIAELAPVETPKGEIRPAWPGEAEGAVPLTPIQHWFFELGVSRRDHWSQSVLVELPANATSDRTELALAKLVEHHAALRLSFREQAGGWGQVVLPFSPGGLSFKCQRIAGDAELENLANEMQRAMRLSAGQPLLAAWIEGPEGTVPRLLLVLHHLAVDAVSWGILLEDLDDALRQLSAGEAVVLKPASEPLKSWSERLSREAQSDKIRGEEPFWTEVASQPATIPCDLEGSSNLERDGEVWIQVEDLAATAAMTGTAAARGRSVQGMLAAALAGVLAPWTGRPSTVVGMEGHGREQFGEGEDLSRTVGWCTAYFPFVLEAVAGEDGPKRVDRICRALRDLPGRGIGFGLLRYLSFWLPEDSAIRTLEPEVIFNYLGVRGGGGASPGQLRPVRWGVGEDRAPDSQRPALLEVNAMIDEGRLRVSWSYNRTRHGASTVRRLADEFSAELRRLSAPASEKTALNSSPTFEESGLGEEDLDTLFG